METPSFGEKLKQERERRNTSIEEIAEETKIALHFLQALERDEFDALPGRAFGKFYIRAYAEVLDFDPEPLIVQYDREQADADGAPVEVAPPEPARPRRVEAEMARWREARRAGKRAPADVAEVDGSPSDSEAAADHVASEAPGESVADEHEVAHEELEPPTPAPVFDREEQAGGARYDEAAALASILGAHESTPAASRRRRVVLATVVGVGLLVVVIWIAVSSLGPDEGPPTSSPAKTGEPRNGETAAEETTSEAVQTPVAQTNDSQPDAAPPSSPDPAPEAAPDSSGITVSEFGLGSRIVNRRLEGRGRSFEEGSVVWFQTRVVGGDRGEKIRHVWMRDGRAVQTVDLELGGSHWRTHSRKTLWGTGSWAVEARDRAGRVLARSDFVCVPAG